MELVSLTELTGTGRNTISLAQVEIDKVAEYACQQAEMLLRVRPQLEAQLNERGQWPLFDDMELPLVGVLYRMERTGVAADIAVLRELSQGDVDRNRPLRAGDLRPCGPRVQHR